jgi:hypothetical protein
MMAAFSLLLEYTEKPPGNRIRRLPPLLFLAENEEEAWRTATAVADFALAEIGDSILLRVVDQQGLVGDTRVAAKHEARGRLARPEGQPAEALLQE